MFRSIRSRLAAVFVLLSALIIGLAVLGIAIVIRITELPYKLTVMIGYATIVFAIVISVGDFLARSLTSSIRRLRDAAQAVGRGDLNTRIVVVSRDEVGQLAMSFNKMAADLKGLLEREKALTQKALQGAQEEKERAEELDTAYSDLEEKQKRLERFFRVTVDREMEMIKLKMEINTLAGQLGQPRRYEVPDKVSAAGGTLRLKMEDGA
ncbi:MAG: HAMP domain-containing protein [Candidatus Omnitrophica bacterium]|nr:HAMP domain-containing protein [Candidatus Omnitrophota bacterium]